MTGPDDPGRFTVQAIREALLAAVLTAGRAESCRAGFLAATGLGCDYHAFDPGQEYQVNPWDKRAIRAFDDLARNGQVVKVPRGGSQPDGRRNGEYAMYYSPERYAAELEAALPGEQAHASVQHRWALVRQQLATIGVDMGAQNTVTLGDWEQRILPRLGELRSDENERAAAARGQPGERL